jgi:BlaI family transcriptional regulator, penicillinase repressor
MWAFPTKRLLQESRKNSKIGIALLTNVRLGFWRTDVRTFPVVVRETRQEAKGVAMAEKPALSKSEMEIVRLLWEIGPATVREIHAEVCKSRQADFATIQTFLRRIECKGYATSKLDGRTRIYSAKTRPRTVIRETVDDLIDRLFGGETLPLVKHLIEERGMATSDIDELRKLVDRLDRETRDNQGVGHAS